jgi:hypothetical protein
MSHVFTHGGWDYYALALFTLGPWSLIDAVCHQARTYRAAGLRKSRWVVTAVASTVLLLGPVFALVYLVTAHRKIQAVRPKRVRTPDYRAPEGSGYRSPPGYTPPKPDYWSQPKTRCTRCSGGKETCRACRNGQVPNPNSGPDTVPCFTCRGTGQVACSSCRGTGFQGG